MRRLARLAVTALLLSTASACTEDRAAEVAKPHPAEVRKTQAPQGVEQIASPAGTGSAEPFLFATRGGDVGLSWLEPAGKTDRFALRFAVFRGGRWSEPRTIVERNDLFVNWADFPSVVEDEKGALFAHWLQKSGSDTYAYDVRMATSVDGGRTWGRPFLLNRDGKQAEHGFVSLAALPGGGVGATWLDGRNMTAGDAHGDHGNMTLRYARVDANGTLSGDEQLDDRTCECCATGMTIAAGGPVIVYRDRSPDEIRDVYFVSRQGESWSKPRPLRADGWKINGCPVNGPQIDSMGPSVATAWFTSAEGRPRVFLAFSGDGGTTFGDAIPVDDGKPLGRVDVELLDESTALVTWLEQTATGAEIRARRIPRTGNAAGSMKIADSAAARAAGFTRIARSGEHVWFAWTDQGAAGKEVRIGRARF